jgi:NADH dehydrogenase (ubiquinone) flavoprotein 2
MAPLHTSATSHGHIFPAHREDASNTSEAHFDFTPENYELVSTILSKYPDSYKRSAIIPLLDLAQRQCNNFLPLAAMNKVARIVDVPPGDVYEVATFYTMFNRERVGRWFIQLCGTTPCMVCGSEDIKAAIENHLGIRCGQTTPDGAFTLVEVECLGACSNAPMVQINDDFYECLTPDSVVDVLKACAAGKPLPMTKWGSRPMNGQLSCEGPQGKTTLVDGPTRAPYCRELPSERVAPESVKQSMMY